MKNVLKISLYEHKYICHTHSGVKWSSLNILHFGIMKYLCLNSYKWKEWGQPKLRKTNVSLTRLSFETEYEDLVKKQKSINSLYTLGLKYCNLAEKCQCFIFGWGYYCKTMHFLSRISFKTFPNLSVPLAKLFTLIQAISFV